MFSTIQKRFVALQNVDVFQKYVLYIKKFLYNVKNKFTWFRKIVRIIQKTFYVYLKIFFTCV